MFLLVDPLHLLHYLPIKKMTGKKKEKEKRIKRNDMSTIFLQQILSGKLLLVIVGAKK